MAFDLDMSEFILRQFADPGNRYQSIYEAKMTESLQYINTKKYVKRFAALFCGNMLAMLQLAKTWVNTHSVKYKRKDAAH